MRRFSQLALLVLGIVVLGIAGAPGVHGDGATAAAARVGVAAPATAASVPFLGRDAAGRPLRYDPCHPIRYVVNPTRGPAGSAADIREAFRRLGAATGIEFVDAGATDEAHVRIGTMRASYQPERYGSGRWAPILVSFADEEQEPVLAGDVLAYGGSSLRAPASAPAAYVTGEVVLDTDLHLVRPGFGPGLTRGNLLLHELAHVVGLDHLDDRASVLYPTISSSSPDGYAAVDVTALAAVGRAAGCFVVAGPD